MSGRKRYLESTPTSLDLEFEIAERVAAALRGSLHPDLAGPTRTAGSTASSTEARDAYLRGTFLLRQGRRRLGDATAVLHASVAADSSYAPGRAALGRALLRNGDAANGRRHLRTAIELDPDYADPHVSLGVDALYALWDQATAGVHFRKALRLDPGNVLSHHPYAYHLSIAGRHQEAIAEMEEALRLDPVSPLVNGDVGRIYYRAGLFDQAKSQCTRTLELVPDHGAALSCLINIHVLEGNPDQAVPFAQASMLDWTGDSQSNPTLDAPTPEGQMTQFFEWKLERMRRASDQGADTYVPMAQAAVFLGRTDEALDALEAALAIRSSILPQVPGDPCFAVLQGDPRYEALLEQLGITEEADPPVSGS